jgi:hypothetical protein
MKLAKSVIVINRSSKSVLVGAHYLLPGERREVLEAHYLAAKNHGDSALALIEPVIELVTEASPAPAEPEAAAVETKLPSRRRGSK